MAVKFPRFYAGNCYENNKEFTTLFLCYVMDETSRQKR